jgi:hypothetical protein
MPVTAGAARAHGNTGEAAARLDGVPHLTGCLLTIRVAEPLTRHVARRRATGEVTCNALSPGRYGRHGSRDARPGDL